jgi:hypothetical protein
MDAPRAVVLVAIVIGSVACVALGNETIAGVLAGGAVGALMPGGGGKGAEPAPAAPTRARARTGRTPVRGVPVSGGDGTGAGGREQHER